MNTSAVHCGTFGKRFDFSRAALERALQGLPGNSFRESVLRYQNCSHQWMSLLSRQLLLQGLSKLDENLDKTTAWSVTTNGRPYIDFLPDFNISHSGKIAVCAIGINGERVGIDVQQEKPVGERHLRQVLSSRELAWVAGDAGKSARLWSRKEAVAKLLGLGMRINFRQLETLDNQVRYQGKVYHLTNIPIAKGYQCSLAGEVPLSVNLDHYYWSSLNKLVKQPASIPNQVIQTIA